MQRDHTFSSSVGGLSSYSKQLIDKQYILEYSLTPKSSRYPNLLGKGFQVLTEEREDHTIECALSVPRFINNLKVLNVFIDHPSVPTQGRSFWVDPERNAFISSHSLILHPMDQAAAEGKLYIIQEGNIQSEYQFRISCRMKQGATPPPTSASASPRTQESFRGPARNVVTSTAPRPSEIRPESRPAMLGIDSKILGMFDTLYRKMEDLTEIVKKTTTQIQETKQALMDTRVQLESLQKEIRDKRPETAFEEYKETLRKTFANLAKKRCGEILAARKPLLAGNRYFQKLDNFATVLESGHAARLSLENRHPDFHNEIRRFVTACGKILEWLTGPDVLSYFTQVEIPSYAKFQKILMQNQTEKWLSKPDEPPVSDFDLASASRRYVFLLLRNEYQNLVNYLTAFSGGEDSVVQSYAQIVNEVLPRHLDEIESLESQGKSRDENLFELVTLYFSSLLNPLGLELIPVEAGDPFDPQLHNNENHLSASGPTVRAVKKRGYRTVTGQIIRKPSIFA